MTSSEFLLAASYDLRVHQFDLSNGSLVGDFEISNSQANRIVVPPGDRRFYVAAYSYIMAYDLEMKSKKPTQAFVAHDSNVTDICVTSNALFSCGEDKAIKTWDRRAQQMQAQILTKDCLNSMILASPHEVIVGGETGQISVWDTRNSNCVFQVNTIKAPVRSLSLAPDGVSFLAAYMNGATVKYRIDGSSFSEVYKIQAHNETQLKVAVAPDGRTFATAAADNRVKLWNLESGDLRQEMFPSDEREWIFDVAFTADSSKLCAGGSDGLCRMWDLETGRIFMQMQQQLEKCVSAVAIWSR